MNVYEDFSFSLCFLFYNLLSFCQDQFLFNRSNSLLEGANLTTMSILPQVISPCLGHSLSLPLEHQSPQSNFSLFSRALPHLIQTIFLLKSSTYIQILPHVSSLIYYLNSSFSFRPSYKLLPLSYTYIQITQNSLSYSTNLLFTRNVIRQNTTALNRAKSLPSLHLQSGL